MEQVFARPATRADLLNLLEKGIECEVLAKDEEITNSFLNEWLRFQGKYKTRKSLNEGWIIYCPISN